MNASHFIPCRVWQARIAPLPTIIRQRDIQIKEFASFCPSNFNWVKLEIWVIGGVQKSLTLEQGVECILQKRFDDSVIYKLLQRYVSSENVWICGSQEFLSVEDPSKSLQEKRKSRPKKGHHMKMKSAILQAIKDGSYKFRVGNILSRALE